jgi:hypothetical protein
MIDFDIILYLKNETDSVIEHTEEMEVKSKYRFNPEEILEVHDTFILYEDEWLKGITVFYRNGTHVNETPPLLGTYKELMDKMKIHERDKKKIDSK